jgi:hypothetical protein
MISFLRSIGFLSTAINLPIDELNDLRYKTIVIVTINNIIYKEDSFIFYHKEPIAFDKSSLVVGI